MVKRPQGSAALVSPCWSPAIWPVFVDQSCNFLWYPLFSVAFRRLGQMNNTKTMIKNILLYPFMLYFFIIKWAHVLMSLFHHQLIFFPPFFVSLCCLTDTILSPFLSSFPHIFTPSCWCLLHPHPLPSTPQFPLCCTHLCDHLLFTHSTSAAPQMRAERAKGRVWCRAQRTGFNEASLNEFTAFHWTAPSHVAD